MRLGISSTILAQRAAKGFLDGIGVYTQALLDQYQLLGVDATKFAFPFSPLSDEYTALPGSFKSLAIKALLRPQSALSMPVDVFHVTDYRAVPMSCPVVTTLYDAIPFVDPAMANNRWRALKNYVLKRSATYADHVIAISNFSVAELVTHYQVPEEKISVIHCGVDEDWLVQPAPDDVDAVLNRYDLERGYLLTVGTLQPRKNLERLISAHNKLTDIQRKRHPLIVVGKRGWNCDALMEALQRKIDLGEARWLNNVHSRDELKCLYAGAEAFAFPSTYEGFGLPVVEAFAMGLPVLTSNATSLPEVSQGVGLEVDPLSINALTEGLEHVLNLPDRVARISAGKKRAQELTWARCASETLKVYESLL